MMKFSHRVKVVLIGVLICGGLMGAVYASLYGWIQWDAHQKAAAIRTEYPQAGDEVAAVILRMQSTECTMAQRNEAVWILGRLADEKALGALEAEYTGKPCDHNRCLCQHELEKAIRRCGGNAHP